jgi:hypothetical protein
MGQLSKKLRSLEGGEVAFWCPGCDEAHGIPVNQPGSWTWDGNVEKPTFNPSLLIRSGHHAPGHQGDECWCTYNAEHPDAPAPFVCSVCHSFVRGGMIQFLGDCTHNLVGQTVEILDWD